MSLGRFVSIGGILLVALVLTSCSSSSPSSPGNDNSIEVNLSRFPDSGDPVPNLTVLSDQWASIGILFDAEPEWVNPIMHNFGGNTSHIFFSPDTQGAIAVFTFVEVGTRTPTDATAFELVPWFQQGESAELVGLDEGGAEVATFTVTSQDIGSESKSIKMSIQGSFRTVEWRTHGDPGIAAAAVAFEF
jgi:hypothetical protein